VVVSSGGQLGIVMSSARYKSEIRDMADSSARLIQLPPVTFHYKGDQTGTIQYGLVAEEVARVYPELVTYGADGKVQTVRYSELTGMWWLIESISESNRCQNFNTCSGGCGGPPPMANAMTYSLQPVRYQPEPAR
jgi:hypothetical protein